MHFCLIDRIVQCTPDRIITHKCVSNAEEYLQDHFSGYPVLPGVMMLEAMVQAARAWQEHTFPDTEEKLSEHPSEHLSEQPAEKMVLGSVRALKYGSMVRPGSIIQIEITPQPTTGTDEKMFRGKVVLLEDGQTVGAVAASGRFTLRPVRVLEEISA